MSSAEKGIAVVLLVVLVGMVGAYVITGNRGQAAQAAASGAGTAAAGGAGCAPTSGGQTAAKTEELGKAGAKLEIVAIVPVAHGCHATSIAELKKAYQAHPNDIHLTIVDSFGPDARKYQDKAGGITWTVIAINGKSEFDVNGQTVRLQRQEGMSYTPAHLIPIIENELKKG
jgi:hypothetical protein